MVHASEEKRRQLAELENSTVTEDTFETSVRFKYLDHPFEEKLIAKEMIPGFFEFNQSFGNLQDSQPEQDPLWSSKLIFDTSYDWFSFTFNG